MIIRPTSGTSSKKRFTPNSWPSWKRCWRSATGISACAGARRKAAPTPKTAPSSMGSMKPGRSYTAEEAYGFAKTGQTICNVTDSKIIKLFVDDEPFWLPNANLLRYDRRLNMKSGTLDREILWETPAGKQVSITSRRLVSFANRHVAAISYCVTLLNAEAFVVISSEMAANEPSVRSNADDPRLARAFPGRVLHPRASYSKDRRIVLCHATEKSRLTLTCATDHALETLVPARLQGCCTPRTSAKSPSQSRPSPAVRSNSPNTWSITRRRRLRLKNSAAALSGPWIA